MGTLNLNNQNIVIDSYDSRDPAKSTNGLYDVAKRQENGDIATDGNLIQAGNAHVYGDVETNSGTATGVANVTGDTADRFLSGADTDWAPELAVDQSDTRLWSTALRRSTQVPLKAPHLRAMS